MSSELLRFLVAGGFAASVNWGSRFVFSSLLSYEASVVLAYVCGMATGFVVMRGWVFKASGQPVRRQILTFIVVNLLGLAQTVGLSSLFARWLLPYVGVVRFREPLAHLVGIAAPVFTSFVAHKRATFRQAVASKDLAVAAAEATRAELAASESAGTLADPETAQ